MTKLKKLQQTMKENGVEGILISSELNQQYISSFAYTDGYIVVFPEKAYLLADFRYIEAAEKEVDQNDFEIIQPKYSQLKLISELARDNGASVLLVEEDSLSLSDLERLERAAEDRVKYASGASKILVSMRAVKDERELEAMARAQEITDAAFTHILNFIKLNMTEKEIALELEFFMRKNGAERTSFDTIAVSGTASSMPHGVPRSCKLERGFLTMDFGCVVDGYCSDMTRTVSIGLADEEMKRLYYTVHKAQAEALAAAAAGERGCFKLDSIARTIIEDAGYKGCFGHSLGHGVGMYIHENPRLAPGVDKNELLSVGNVVTFEPGIYIPDKYGCRIEDMAAITETGIRNFTHSKKDLIEIC